MDLDSQRIVEGEAGANAAPVPVWGRHNHLAERLYGAHQVPEALRADPIIISHKYSHPAILSLSEDHIIDQPRQANSCRDG